MSERDPSFDMALRLLASADPPAGTDDDARWAKKVVGALGGRSKPLGAAELDALLAAPLPDDHEDPAVHEALADDDLIEEHADAAHAAEAARGDDRGWENAISSPPTSGPTSGLDGLARLQRTGPSPSSRAPDLDVGAAKGEDSGLIDLRGVSQSGEKPVAPGLAAVAAPSSASASSAAPARASAERAAVAGSPLVAGGAAMAAGAPPSSSATTTAAGAPTSTGAAPAASSRSSRKKGGVVWITFGGLAAAAAAGLFFVQSRKSAEPTSAVDTRSAPAGAATIGAPSTLAAASATAPIDTPEPAPVVAASAAPSDEVIALAPTATVAPKAGELGGKSWAAGGSKKNSGPDLGTPPPAKDVAKPGAAPTQTATPPPQAGSGGGLDDVLGLNKPAMPTSTVASTPNLPDKPEAADIRVAVNARVGAASACVKGLVGESSIVVQFSPAGTVSSVSVTAGPAKGTGAESCIKSAFASAKVPRSKLGGTGYAKAFP